jgi:hypothetical protein
VRGFRLKTPGDGKREIEECDQDGTEAPL